MITVTRTAHIEGSNPADIFRALSDTNGLGQLLPRVRKVEMLERNSERARLVTHMSLGGVFGTIRCEGELTWTEPSEILFIVKKPLPVETRWGLNPTATGTELVATITLDLAPMLGPMNQFVPEQAVADMLAKELETAIKGISSRMRRERLRLQAA